MEKVATVSYTHCLHCGGRLRSKFSNPFCCSGCEFLSKIETAHGTLGPELTQQVGQSREKKGLSYLYRIDGIHCASCVHLIEKLPSHFPFLNSATVDLSRGLLHIDCNQVQDLMPVQKQLEDWGYQVQILAADHWLEQEKQPEQRQELIRLGITAALVGNIMLMTIPIYAGAESEIRKFFLWGHFLLFLPVLFYSAWPFYRSAWNALAWKTLNIDVSITLALWVGFAFSTYSLVIGGSEVYFDSTASFLFLILLTRFFIRQIQKKVQPRLNWKDLIPTATYSVFRSIAGNSNGILSPSAWSQTTTEKILPGDWVRIQAGQIVPADGSLESLSCEIDSSILTGESLPQIHTVGMRVRAGTRVVSKEMMMRVEQIGESTAVGRIQQDLDRESLKKNKMSQLSDRLSQYLIGIVFAIAILYFTTHFRENFQAAFQRSLALLIIACPCALAFGTPLTFAFGLHRARRKGLLVRNSHVFEKCRKIKNIFIDKTGTLTEGALQLYKTYPQEIDMQTRELILSLEAASEHPVAFGFRRAWQLSSTLLVIEDLQEKVGIGVCGVYQGNRYSLEKDLTQDESGSLKVVFKKDGHASAYFYFADQLRPESKSVLQSLQKNFDVHLLSGDRNVHVERMARECGLSRNQMFSEVTPFEKKKIVESFSHTMMVGDGVNDTLAIQAADIGIAVQSGQIESQKVADVILLKAGLEPILQLFEISKKTYRTLITTLTFSLLYNVCAGVLALCGWITPLTAAILMPVSSILIALIAWGGQK